LQLQHPHHLAPFIVVALGLGAGCSSPPADAEHAEVLDQGVVGGRVTTTAHPAVGYLAYHDEETPFCTATLVAATYVVTAAHCVQGVRATDLVFGTGKFDMTKRRTAIERCRYNTKYKDTDATSIYDFAFCELGSAPAGVTPLAFVTAPALGATYLGLGYGQTDPDDEWSAGPRKQISIKRVDPEDEPLLEGLEQMFATTSKTGDLCFGDSGSPLLVIGSNGVAKVAGVLNSGITDGDSDCAAGNISVWAPIAKNLSFYESR